MTLMNYTAYNVKLSSDAQPDGLAIIHAIDVDRRL